MFFKKRTQRVDATQKQDTTSQNVEKTTVSSTDSPRVSTEASQKQEKARIYNLIIADESGSMSHLRSAVLSGINETIETIRAAQEQYAQTQEQFLSLVTFDSDSRKESVRTLIDCAPISKVKTFSDYNPCGCTPLYDAVGRSLTLLHNRIKNDKDAMGVVTVMTDGLENSSVEWSGFAIRQLIERLKEEGWVFSYMGSDHDVLSVSVELSIDNVMEFAHDEVGQGSAWEKERASRTNFYGRMNDAYCCETSASAERRREIRREQAGKYYSHRVTPRNIRSLERDEVFVFGSNAQGFHGGGAARTAVEKFGAVVGVGEGLQGQSYAIPSMEGLDNLRHAVDRFVEYAREHQGKRFLVTRIGCGIAGYKPEQIAPLFKGCIGLENVTLPSDFWDVLGLRFYE